MHFAGIDIPRDLVAAHAEGEVVFFVGAGASMGTPTNLPNFSELARRVSEKVSADAPTEVDLQEPDVLLGRLDGDERRDIHGLVELEIARAKRRNKLHDALAQLSSSSDEIRLVTTNFDHMLSRALRAQGLKHKVHEAPALPLGSDFEGLVHLHGRLGQPPHRLVVTDRDFGVAYITRGWAPAFLRDLFSTYVVCFVGYSHEDRMMEYFAKGLPSNARPRYILTDNDNKEHWKQLGVIPVCYPEKQHNTVLAALQRWGTWARDTPLGRAERVRAFAGDAPPVDPDDIDFLLEALLDRRLTAEVCAVASSREWVDWMLAQPPTALLLGDQHEHPVDARVLSCVADWIAREGTGSDSFQAVYDAVANRRGQAADPSLVSAVIEQIAKSETESSIRSAWFQWTLSAATPGNQDHRLRYEFLWASDVFLQEADAFLLLEHLVAGWSSPAVGPFGSVRDSELLVDEWRLRDGCKRRFNTTDFDVFRILNWLTAFFEQAHRRVCGESGFDPWSFGRSSIQPHEQDQFGSHEAANVMIDLARDSLARAIIADRARAERVREMWLDSSAPLLRRIGLDSVGRDVEMAPVSRLAVLEDRGWYFDFDLQNEVFNLVARATEDDLDHDAVDMFVAAVSVGPETSDDSDEVVRDRQIYELLHWAIKHGDETIGYPPALAAIEAKYPQWRPSDNPGFKTWMESGSRSLEDEWPWQPEELHDRIQADAQGTTSLILQLPAREEGIGWWPAGDVLKKVVERWPQDGFAVWSASETTSLRACVIEGWAVAALDEGQISRVADTLLGSDLTGLGPAVARLLRPWTNDAATRERWVGRATGRQLALKVFGDVADAEAGVKGTDAYTASINSSVGVLAEFWIAVVAHDMRVIGDAAGLSTDVRNALNSLLARSEHRELVLAPLLLRLRFLLRVDREWTVQHLMASIDPSENRWDEIEPLWEITLRGSVNEELLDAGVRGWLVDCASHASPDSAVGRSLARVVALVAVHSTMDDTERLEWLRSWVAQASDSLVVDWAREVARVARDLEKDARGSLWSRWMHAHVKARVESTPRIAAESEVMSLVEWTALFSGGALHELVDLILQFKRGIDPSWSRWDGHAFEDETLSDATSERGRLLLGLLKCTNELSHWVATQLSDVAGALANHGLPATLRHEISIELYRLGVNSE